MGAFAGKTAVVTGGARGIGRAVVDALTAADADVWIFDLADPDEGCVSEGRYITCDVSDATALSEAVERVQALSNIDIYVSNAGVMSRNPGHAQSINADDWARCWQVNVMAHVHAARVLLPSMVSREAGHFVIVASAAGLLSQIGDAAYSATKHAAVSFAQSLAIEHGTDGLRVCCVCPQYVATSMIGHEDGDQVKDGVLDASVVAQDILMAMEEGRFMCLPHGEVAAYAQSRAADFDRWIGGMQRLRATVESRSDRLDPRDFPGLV